MNARQVLAAAGIALAALVGGGLVAVAQTVVESSTPEPETTFCVPVGSVDEDALPANLADLGVPYYYAAGHGSLCADSVHAATVARERAAIAAAGGYIP